MTPPLPPPFRTLLRVRLIALALPVVAQVPNTLPPAQPDSFSVSSTTVLINNATTLKVRDNFLIGTSPPRFMRVKVTASP